MIKYILENNHLFQRIRGGYTNAPFIVADTYDFKDGLFSGLMPKRGSMIRKCGGLSNG
jgi:formate dehydrogenase major subunit